MSDSVLILYSGGADSRLMYEFAKSMKYDKIKLVIMDYNQLHHREIDISIKFCIDNKIDYELINISGYGNAVKSALTSGDKGLYSDVHEYNVPGRNSVFLSVAYGIAESQGYNKLWIGCDWSDRIHLFPDCYQDYIVAMNNVFSLLRKEPIQIECPIMGLTKEMVLSLLSNTYNVKDSEYFSGYGDV